MTIKLRSSIKIGMLIWLSILYFDNESAFGNGSDNTLQSAPYSSNLPIASEMMNSGFPTVFPDPFIEVEAIFYRVAPVASAGGDKTICEDQIVNLVGFAQNYSVVSWSGGDGVFSEPNSLITSYTPGTGDKAAGVVDLCLTAELFGLIPLSVVDCLSLSIYFLPSVSAGMDATTCESQIFETSPALSNSFMSLWITSGDGFFYDDALEVTNYIAGPNDLAEGQVELCLIAIGNLPCITEVSDCMMLFFEDAPIVNASDDFSICNGTNAQLFCTANNVADLLWVTSGTGTFDDATIHNPVYTPDMVDIANGSVEFYLTGIGTGTCELGVVEDDLLLSIVGQTTISGLAAERVLDCGDYDFVNFTFLPLELFPDIENASSIIWTTDGDGTFSDTTAENPVYHPGTSDIWNGGFNLCVNACQGVCSYNVESCIHIVVPIQIIPFETPSWKGISSYVDKNSTTVPGVMAPVVNDLIFIFNKEGKYYWPSQDSVNQLGNWQPIGYKAKFKSSSCLPIYGQILADQSFVVNGASTFLPVLTNIPANIKVLLGANVNKVLMIYDWSAGKIWTNNAADFQTLEPGKAYLLIQKNSTTSFNVTFPAFDPTFKHKGSGLEAKSEFIVGNSPWNGVTNTSQPHVILFAGEAADEIQPGDIIGAFNQNGLCLGVTEYEGSESFFRLIVMGDDPTTEGIDGYESGENMNFRLFRPATNATFNIDFTYDPNFPNNDGTFAVNGVSTINNIAMTLSAINELSIVSEIKIFPNPAKKVINIKSDANIRQVKLINITGQSIIQNTLSGTNIQVDVSKYVKGLYFLQMETYDGTKITKRVVIE